MKHLWKVGLHTGPLTSGEDDDVDVRHWRRVQGAQSLFSVSRKEWASTSVPRLRMAARIGHLTEDLAFSNAA
jgi:hypothetical protein